MNERSQQLELLEELHQISGGPDLVGSLPLNEAEIARIKEIACSLDYFRIYGQRRGIATLEAVCLGASKTELVYRSCSVEGCHSPLPFYNIKNRVDLPDDWRCSQHIPSEVTFPIGLHGDEWAATGRTPVVWRVGR